MLSNRFRRLTKTSARKLGDPRVNLLPGFQLPSQRFYYAALREPAGQLRGHYQHRDRTRASNNGHRPVQNPGRMVKGSALDAVDFISCNVEGHELEVLTGGINLFRAGKAAFLLVEAKSVLPSQISGPGVSLEQLSGFLDPFGYRLLVLYTDFIHLPTKRYYTNFNALYAMVRE